MAMLSDQRGPMAMTTKPRRVIFMSATDLRLAFALLAFRLCLSSILKKKWESDFRDCCLSLGYLKKVKVALRSSDKVEMRIVMVGLDGAGKTTILYEPSCHARLTPQI
jgi:ADP-ribosylation factor family